jgi:Zn-dependent protease with chaperone function
LNFFAAQDQARRTSRRLVYVYLLATLLIVAGVTFVVGAALFFSTDTGYGVSFGTMLEHDAPILIATAIVTTLVILGAPAYKTAVLSAGGGRVAADLGGTLVPPDVRDPLRRRLRNVVEEMAIASGTPVPEIYVLEQESGINAFAAGYEPGDAAIAVTRGTLELLNRDELQGVIGHEFSHILNGDMRLNIRLMGVLFGIMAIGLIGRMILRGGRHGAFIARSRGKGAPAVLVIGLGLAVLGGIGVMLARMIKASVSRQREYLADASAVQFTRQTTGIANALKKIGGYGDHSYLQATDPEEVSHMLFGAGSKMSGMFSTHPPLTERIQALDPSFDPSEYPEVDLRSRPAAVGKDRGRHAGIAAAVPGADAAHLPAAISDMIGQPETAHIAHAAALRESVPALLYEAAHSSETAYLLVIALILDRSGRALSQQLSLAEQQLGRERTSLIQQYFDALAKTGAEYRLPLMEIAVPALRRRPLPQLDYLVELAGGIIDVDGEIDIYEYCFYRILVANLEQARDPSKLRKRRRAEREPVQRAAIDLLRVVASYGHVDDMERKRAFQAGVAVFGKWGQRYTFETDRKYTVDILDQSLDMLLALNGEGQQMLLEAVTAVVLADQRLALTEAELIRAICASLNCPLPPILVDNPVA